MKWVWIIYGLNCIVSTEYLFAPVYINKKDSWLIASSPSSFDLKSSDGEYVPLSLLRYDKRQMVRIRLLHLHRVDLLRTMVWYGRESPATTGRIVVNRQVAR